MLPEYLAELLYDHDCVIIPGLGGLIAHTHPARIDESKRCLLPPARTVAFNSNLQINDGLLANHISRNENISYSEACRMIMNRVAEIKKSVNEGNRFFLPGIGSLYLNHERELQFSPETSENFLPSAFGLKNIQLPASPGKRKERTSSVLQPNKPVSDLIPVAAVIALLIISWLAFPRFEFQLASLSMSGSPAEVMQAPAVKNQPASHPLPEPDIKAAAPSDSVSSVVLNPAPEVKQVNDESVTADELLKTEEVPSADLPASGPYHIIAGCFRIEENAINLEQELRSSGLPAQIIGKTKTGLKMVSAGSYQTSAMAQQAIHQLNHLLADGAWVFKKNN